MTGPHPRYVRRRKFSRFARKSRVLAFLNDRATDLNGTAASQDFTAAISNVVTIAGHGFTTGDGPFEVSNSGGALPAGLAADTLYWVRVIDANGFTLHTDPAAVRDDVQVDITGVGTGTHSIARSESASGLLEWLRQRVKPRRLAAVADVDSLP